MTKLAGMSVPLFLIECRKPLFGDKYVVILFWIRKLFVIVVVFDVLCIVDVQRVSDRGSSKKEQEEESCGSTE